MKILKILPLIIIGMAAVSCRQKPVQTESPVVVTVTESSADSTETESPADSAETESPAEICYEVVEEILTTSPSFLKLTDGLSEAVRRNGGSGYGFEVEGSPNPEKDGAWSYSETYDFAVHESYEDRIVTIARYTFDVDELQLYQYDNDMITLIPIKFNKKLLQQVTKRCKYKS